MIARLYGGTNEGFGHDLTPNTVEHVITSIRAESVGAADSSQHD